MTFDREEQKSYSVPIAISDSGVPSMTGTSTLTVIIGDQNDNAMRPGASSIFVYNYKVIILSGFFIILVEFIFFF